MAGGQVGGDPLARWLADEARVTLDVILGSALDIVAVLDRELVLRYVNRTAYGLQLRDVIGHTVMELAPPDYRELVRASYSEVLQSGAATRIETMYRDAQGLHIWDVRIGPIRTQEGIIGLICFTSNVTEQRRADADRDRFFSLSLDMLVVIGADGAIKRANPAFSEVLGYEPDELLGAPFSRLVHPDDRTRSLDAFERMMRGSRVSDLENRYMRKDGEILVFSWRATVDPITGDMYAVARDITAQRMTEAQLRHSQKMEAVGQLAGGIAHDFNNLMLAILGNAELALQSGPQVREVVDCLEEIEGASRRAADLTRQLLAFSRRQPLHPIPIDLNQLVRGVTKMLRRLLPESISIEFIPGRELASVNADPTQLEQVILNLSLNARDAMERGGQLTLETSNIALDERYCQQHAGARPGSYVLLRVTDTGSGMSPEVREHIFEPFFTTKSPHRGTGLGLSTVYGIVQQHDGSIDVISEPDMGSSFEIYLPADYRAATDLGAPIDSSPPRGRETLLVAEDDERVRRVAELLLRRAGYRTLVVANGAQAIRVLREADHPIHLVLLDLVMPELSGPETWERMQSLRPDLRVLFTSGYADERYRERLPPGAEVLEKPFRVQELLRRIRKRLDE